MAKKQVRDSTYYEERLKRDHPVIYADLQAGKHRTVTDAAIAAGLKKTRTRLHELKNAWSKADPAEQVEFLRWLGSAGVILSILPTSTATITSSLTIAIGRRLTPVASRRIEEIMAKRGLKPRDVMAEMGYPRLNASIGMALARGTHLQPDVIVALEKWLGTNASI